MVLMEKLWQTLRNGIVMVRTYYQHVISVAFILLTVLVFYWSDFQILANEALQSEDLSHILLIPFFAGFLFYLKRDVVKGVFALEKSQKRIGQYDELVGVILCLVAFLLYWYGSYTFYPLEYHILSLVVFIMGVTLILAGMKVLMTLIFPILFLLFLVPPPSEFLYITGGILANFNTNASYIMLKALGLPVTLSSAYGPPTIAIVTSTQQPLTFAIDLPCSGIYSLIAFVMLAAFLALVGSSSVLRKIGLFLTGFVIFEILNILRITTIVLAGYYFGEEMALLVFHTVTGFLLIFVGMLITLLVAEKILKIKIFSTSGKPLPCPICRTDLKKVESFCLNCGRALNLQKTRISKRFWTKLFLLFLGITIATLSIHAPTLAIAQEAIEVTSGWDEATNILPPNIQIGGDQDENYTLFFLYRDEAYERQAHQDASLTYAYYPMNKSRSTVYVTVGVAKSLSNLHSWEVCLITWQTAWGQQPLVSVLDSRDIQLLKDVPLIARYLVFERSEHSTQMTLYWYEKAAFRTGITVEQRYVRLSVIILVGDSAEYEALENDLVFFGQNIASYWRPLESQSLVSLGVPTLQLLLVLSIAFLIFAKTVQYLTELRRKRNNLKIFGKIAPPRTKLVLDSISGLAKEKKMIETRDISRAVEKGAKESMKLPDLFKILEQLEEYGFIRREVASIENNPKLVWKTKVSSL